MQTTVCARPGCSGAATAWLTYDYAAQQAWLDDQPARDLGNQWGLCGTHAARLRAPRGWTQVDRRAAGRDSSHAPTTLVPS
jgi:hypothetical protein